MAEDLLKEPLPEPWTFGVTSDGRVFFINDEEKITTWLHPDTGNPVRTGFRPFHELPKGWECGFTEDSALYYIDHNNHSTSFRHPDEQSPKTKAKRQSEQQKDTSAANHSYVNVDDNPGQEKKKRKGSFRGFQAGISLFRRSSSKVRKSESDTTEKTPRKERKEKMKIAKKPRAAMRPTSAQSIRSTQSVKMQVTWRDPNNQISKSGWLYKQDSTGKMKMWRKRWFILDDFCLYYYKDNKEDEILGNIILPSYTVSTLTPEDKINRKYSFKVHFSFNNVLVEHAGMRTYYFSADSYCDMADWITALGKSCSPISPTKTKDEKMSEDVKEKRDSLSEDDSDSIRGKKRDSSEPRKKSKQNEVSDDSEFGFNHVAPSSSQSQKEKGTSAEKVSANQSMNNNKYDPEIMHKNGQLSRDQRSPKEEIIRKHEVDMPPRRKAEDRRQQKSASPSSPVTTYSNNQQEVMTAQVKVPLKNTSQGQVNSQLRQSRPAYRNEPNRQQNMQLRQPATSQKNARRENGESAYFSDTSGATDSSRFANSSDRSNTNRGAQTQNGQQNQVKRQNSLVKLGSWVMNQRMRQQSQGTLSSPQRTQPPSNFDTASEFSSVSQQQPRKSAMLQTGRGRTGPPSSRRYRSRTYNEYMDPMEVASSIISMPPIQHMGGNKMYVTHSMPRPLSSENINKMGQSLHSVPEYGRKQDRRMVASKSAGNIVAPEPGTRALSSPPRSLRPVDDRNSIKRAKSDYVYQDMKELEQHYISNFKKAQQMEQMPFRASRQQQQQQMSRPVSEGRQALRENRPNESTSNSSSGGVTPRHSRNVTPRSNKTPRYDDVFTPRSDGSSMSSASAKNKKNGQVFQFDTVNAAQSRSNRKYINENYVRKDNPPSSLKIPDQNHLRKASGSGVEVKQIQKGQLRAFVLSAKSPQQSLPPPQRQTPLKASENVSRENSLYRMSTNDRDIETKLQKLQEFEKALDKILVEVANLQPEKKKLNAKLGIMRSTLQTRYPLSSDNGSQLESEYHQLEQKIENVNIALQTATKRLKSMKSKNEDFDADSRRLKSQILNELKNQRSMSDDVYHRNSVKAEEMKRKLEWELGRIEFILEGLRKNKQKVVEKLKTFTENQKDGSTTLLMTHRTPTSLVSSSGDMRSPRRLSGNRPSYSSTSSGGTPNTTPVKKYFTLPGRGVTPAKSVDALTAESLVRSSRPTSARSVSSIGSSSSNLHRTKSAAERLFNTPYNNMSYDHEAKKLKKLQKDITRDRKNIFKTSGPDALRRYSNPSGMTLPVRSQMKVGIDVQMALKQHRMPKVLQRAKRDMAEKQMLAEKANQMNSGLYGKENYNGKDEDTDSDEIQVDVNLTHQLIAPEKVEIPERYIEYENVELSPAEEKMKHRKVAAIEKLLAKSGHQASLPAVHLAAALAVEAGSVARAVAMHATSSTATQRTPGDGQKDGTERPVTDGSSSAGEDPEPGQSPLRQDPEYSEAYIV